ncbi:MAG: TIGR02206 family membrane protein [Halanaerobium sp.]|nr:TIGR02206 family membrane protein [Halanaerobium sp.]
MEEETMASFFALEAAKPFVLFSLPHLLTIFGLGLVIFLIYHFRHKLREDGVNRIFRYSLVGLLFLAEFSLNIWRISWGIWDIQTSLPFHLCGVGIIFSSIMLLTRKYLLYELTYFWGLIGAFLAIVIPPLEVTYTNYRFWQFMLGHGAIVMAVYFMIAVEGYRPYFKSILKAFLFTNIYMGIMAAFDYLTGANYLYLCARPEGAAGMVFSFFGPWPWYLISLEVLALSLFFIYYLPYALLDYRAKTDQRTAGA